MPSQNQTNELKWRKYLPNHLLKDGFCIKFFNFSFGKHIRKTVTDYNYSVNSWHSHVYSALWTNCLHFYRLRIYANAGSRFLNMTSQRRVPFLFPEIFPGSFFYQENYEDNNNSKHLKLDHKPFGISQLAMSVKKGQLPAKSIQHPYRVRKQDPSKVHSDGATLSVQEFPEGQNSSCALSLLSADSQGLLHNSTDVSPTLCWTVEPNHHIYIQGDHRNLENSPRVSLANSLTPIELYSSDIAEQDRVVQVPDSEAASFGIQRDHGHDQRSNSINSMNCLSPEGGPTMDLVQLSSHLQRVEQQKNSVQVKQENDIFCSFTST